MLIGQYHTKLSNKGRTAIPAKFRKDLGTKVVISRWYENSLAVFSESAWEKILDLAVGGTLLTESARDTERFLMGQAYESELDDQGRLVIPSNLREYASLKDEIVFLGLKNRAEIWSKEDWINREQEITKHASQLIEQVQKSKWD